MNVRFQINETTIQESRWFRISVIKKITMSHHFNHIPRKFFVRKGFIGKMSTYPSEPSSWYRQNDKNYEGSIEWRALTLRRNSNNVLCSKSILWMGISYAVLTNLKNDKSSITKGFSINFCTVSHHPERSILLLIPLLTVIQYIIVVKCSKVLNNTI